MADIRTITRFAPSPTGLLHVGNLRTAALNWAFARQRGGRFLLRLDDTDADRSTPEFADAIRRDMEWLGLDWDGEVRQSGRLHLYAEAAANLGAQGRLYDCFETREELERKRKAQRARGRPPVYDRAALALSDEERAGLAADRAPHRRFLLEHRKMAWDDLIRGPQRIDAGSLSDPVLVREDGQVLYTLASVVDDAEMGVTDVLRGADHVTNTAVQLQLFAALGSAPPRFGHHALLTDGKGEPLSKRRGASSADDLREAGIEPVALLSFLLRIGSADPVEVATDRKALAASVDLARLGLAPTVYDRNDLARHSARTLRALPFAAVAGRLDALGIPSDVASDFWAAIGPNLDRLEEAREWWAICRDGAEPAVDPEDAGFVAEALAMLPPRPWGRETWKAWTAEVKDRTGRRGRALFQPLRKALTGRDSGPEMAALMPLLRAPPRAEE